MEAAMKVVSTSKKWYSRYFHLDVLISFPAKGLSEEEFLDELKKILHTKNVILEIEESHHAIVLDSSMFVNRKKKITPSTMKKKINSALKSLIS